MISERLNHLIKSGTALLGLALFGFLIVSAIREGTKVSTWSETGMIRLARVEIVDDSTIVFRRVPMEDFAGPPYPAVGDTVLTLRDSVATEQVVINLMENPQEEGSEVAITYRHEGEVCSSALLVQLPAASQYWLILILQWLRFLVGFGFISVGLWAFFARPDSAAVRVFALFCASMTSLMIAGVHVLGEGYAAFAIPSISTVEEILQVFVVLGAGFWLNLQMLFARPLRLMEKHPVWAHGICYLIPVIAAGLDLLPSGIELPEWVGTVMNTGMAVLVLAGFVILGSRFRTARDRLERRQTRLVLWGSAIGISFFIILLIVEGFFREWFTAEPLRPLILINTCFALLLIMPLTYAYAFGRYRLLEVQGRLRRGTRHLLMIVLLGILYGGLVVLIGDFLVKRFGITSNAPIIVIALLLALGVTPLNRRLRLVLDRRFFPERERLRSALQGFLEGPDYLADRGSFWNQLETRIREAMMVESVVPVVAGNNGADFAVRQVTPTPFARDSALVRNLEQESRPVLVDELIASGRVSLSADEDHWLLQNGVALIMPLVAQQRLVGFLGIGIKTEREDYAPEELRILSLLSPQVALASENVRLIEENVEKQRLQEQMQIARRIQEGFLPQTLPDTPGLEVAAGSRFSLEVAGDYYDVIALDGGVTVLAVGDVSGKGAGAALLMANLQASLRTAFGVGVPLEDAVARINDLIYRNTPPEQYITFVAAEFSPSNRLLSYVNAGHNPPIVVRSSGEHELLETGGLILGCLPGAPYEKGFVELAGGDLLIMYTDGVSEAMTDDGEEYGDERIARFVIQRRDLTPDEILRLLEEDVKRFCGRTPVEDDSTLLIARVRRK